MKPSLTPEQHRRVVALFRAACNVDPPTRRALLEDSGEVDAVVARVAAMLTHHDGSGHPLDGPGPGVALVRAATLDAERDEAPPPERIGDYRVLRRLGAGGMGVVYAAEQTHPQREVALKVLHAGVISPARRRRFDDEARALARLQHPGIATIYEAGVAHDDHGRERPFLAMEIVDGPTILAYAREHGLGPREIAALMLPVCEAVHAAHLKGVIHRDLKPANILVRPDDAAPQPKVLDFGIARLTDADVDAATLDTDTDRLLGTLPYMSPEQLEGDPAAIDVRVDVHALGVVLYELLADRLPVEIEGRGVAATLRALATTPPTPLRDAAPAVPTDLATIAMTALHRDPDRRYDSAGELAADLRRFLDHQPIAARPPSPAYRLGRFARRHRAVVVATAALVVVLVAGATAAAVLAVQATAARDRAEREADVTRALNEFVRNDLLRQASPDEQPDRDLTLRAALENGATLIDRRFADDPEIAGHLHETVGQTYLGLGELDAAEHHLDRAVAVLEAAAGPDDPATLRARASRGPLLHARGRFAEGLEELDDVARRQDARLGADHRDLLVTRFHRATMRLGLGRAEEAAVELEDVLLGYERRGEGDTAEAIEVRRRLAGAELALGRWEACATHLRLGLEACERLHGPDHAVTAGFLEALGLAARDQGHYEEARGWTERAIDVHTASRGPEHPRTLAARTALATILRRQDDVDGAARIDREILEIRTRTLGPDHPKTLVSLNAVALDVMEQGDLDRAATLLEAALARHRRVFGDTHRDTLASRFNLGLLRLRREEWAAAESHFAEAAAGAAAQLPPGHWRVGHYTLGRGRALAGMGDTARAETHLLEAHAILHDALGPAHRRTRKAAEFLAELYEANGDATQAAAWRERAGSTP